MAMSDLGVMGSLLMRARFMVLCGFAVVLGRFIMVMRGFLVMLVNVVVGHLNLPVLEGSTVAVRHDILMTPCEAERPQSGTYRLSRPVDRCYRSLLPPRRRDFSAYWSYVMSLSHEFYDYADEHFGWAETAKSEHERAIFLQMAAAWLEAAQQCEGHSPSAHEPVACRVTERRPFA
jgi:hypothetical protein